MNSKERKWIKEQLHKILVDDLNPELDLDCQADDITEFLSHLDAYVSHYPYCEL